MAITKPFKLKTNVTIEFWVINDFMINVKGNWAAVVFIGYLTQADFDAGADPVTTKQVFVDLADSPEISKMLVYLGDKVTEALNNEIAGKAPFKPAGM